MDFKNMLERERLASKKISKTQSVQSQLRKSLDKDSIHIGPSDHVPWLKDRKWAQIRLEGQSFGDVPLNIELKLEVWDSPNSAGIVIDAIRCCRLALDRGVSGPLVGPLSGVLIDRWSRRLILVVTPTIRFGAVLLLLPWHKTNLFIYAPALIVVSLNRFYLANASAVTPVLVEDENLLMANSMGSVGGTVATFVGVVAGTKLVDPIGTRGVLLVLAGAWPAASFLASRIRDPLRPAQLPAALR